MQPCSQDGKQVLGRKHGVKKREDVDKGRHQRGVQNTSQKPELLQRSSRTRANPKEWEIMMINPLPKLGVRVGTLPTLTQEMNRIQHGSSKETGSFANWY